MSTKRLSRQRGLSLIELIIFMVVMGIAATTVLQMMNIASKSSADPVRRKQALLLAESYMEEVQLARFTYCDPSDPNAATATSAASCSTPEVMGPESGNSRPYDNVNDYNGANFSDASGNLADVNGNAIDPVRLAGYSATVTVSSGSGLGPSGSTIIAVPADPVPSVLHIQIQVRYGTGANDFVKLDGYRTRYAPQFVP